MMEKNMDTRIKEEKVTSFLKLPVYTRDGIYVGHVRNVFLDMDAKEVSGILVGNTNPSLVEGSVDVSVPYRWVNAVGDIIILSYFPDRVVMREEENEETEEEEENTGVDMVK